MATVVPTLMGGGSNPTIANPAWSQAYNGTIASVTANTKQYNSLITITPDSNASEFKDSNVVALMPTTLANTYGLAAGDKVLFWPRAVTLHMMSIEAPAAGTGTRWNDYAWVGSTSYFRPQQQGYNVYVVSVDQWKISTQASTGETQYVSFLLGRHKNILAASGRPPCCGGSTGSNYFDVNLFWDDQVGIYAYPGLPSANRTSAGIGYALTVGNDNGMKVYSPGSDWSSLYKNVNTYGEVQPYIVNDAAGHSINGYCSSGALGHYYTETLAAQPYLWAVWQAWDTQIIKL